MKRKRIVAENNSGAPRGHPPNLRIAQTMRILGPAAKPARTLVVDDNINEIVGELLPAQLLEMTKFSPAQLLELTKLSPEQLRKLTKGGNRGAAAPKKSRGPGEGTLDVLYALVHYQHRFGIPPRDPDLPVDPDFRKVIAEYAPKLTKVRHPGRLRSDMLQPFIKRAQEAVQDASLSDDNE
jgi:hypothetical protein